MVKHFKQIDILELVVVKLTDKVTDLFLGKLDNLDISSTLEQRRRGEDRLLIELNSTFSYP